MVITIYVYIRLFFFLFSCAIPGHCDTTKQPIVLFQSLCLHYGSKVNLIQIMQYICETVFHFFHILLCYSLIPKWIKFFFFSSKFYTQYPIMTM